MSYLLSNRMRCPASFYQQHQFQLGKHQRLSRGAISQAVLDTLARLEAKWSLELNQAQLSNEYVEGKDPAPHIHEQMATANYVQMATTLRTPLRITTSRLSTMR